MRILGCFSRVWKNSFSSWRKTMRPIESSRNDRRNRLREATQKTIWQNTSMTALTALPTSCSPRCSKLLLQKTYAGSFPTRIKPGSPLRTLTKFSSPTIGLRWTKRLYRFKPYWKIRSSQIWNKNKMSQLSDLSKGNKTDNRRFSTTGATTIHEDKVTDQTSTTTTARTPTNQNPMQIETVNSVSIAKFWTILKKSAANQ